MDSTKPRELRIDGVSKSYRSVQALKSVTFSAQSGQVLGLVGPNGAGKTTLIGVAAGLVVPDSGAATVGGVSTRSLPNQSAVIGVVHNGLGVHPRLTARKAVLQASLSSKETDADALLDEVELLGVASRRVGGFSLGMRLRLKLAIALAPQPRIMLLDEPFNGLDPPGIQWLRTQLRRWAADGRCVVVSTHLLDEVARVADRVVSISDGLVVTDSSLTELTGQSQGSLVTTPDVDALVHACGVAGIAAQSCNETQVIVDAEPVVVGDLAYAVGVRLHGLQPAEDSAARLYGSLYNNGEGT